MRVCVVVAQADGAHNRDRIQLRPAAQPRLVLQLAGESERNEEIFPAFTPYRHWATNRKIPVLRLEPLR
jgi:hypothetical protein